MTHLPCFVDTTAADNAQSWLGSVTFKLDADQCNITTGVSCLADPVAKHQAQCPKLSMGVAPLRKSLPCCSSLSLMLSALMLNSHLQGCC